MISHIHKCIFVHIPKSGGSSIESLIWPGERLESELWMGLVSKYHNKYQTGGLQHLFASQIRDHVGITTFDAYFKFSFVRNPWDKVISQFSYMSVRPDLMDFIGMKKSCSFKKYLELIRQKTHVQWDEQYKFVYDHNLNLLVDFLGRFENLEADATAILGKLDMAFEQLPHSNRSQRKTFDSYWDDEAKEMVENMYSTDIEVFGYSFPD